MVNKNDPYNAITCLYNMMAMLPDESRPDVDDLEKQGTQPREWVDDPDEHDAMSDTWEFFRKLSFKVEESVAKYVANVQTRKQF